MQEKARCPEMELLREHKSMTMQTVTSESKGYIMPAHIRTLHTQHVLLISQEADKHTLQAAANTGLWAYTSGVDAGAVFAACFSAAWKSDQQSVPGAPCRMATTAPVYSNETHLPTQQSNRCTCSLCSSICNFQAHQSIDEAGKQLLVGHRMGRYSWR